MKWIGLTGGIGTGKSTVAKLLRLKGHPVLDADQYAKKAIEKGTKGYQEVLSAFSPDILGSDGEIDRKKLAKIVFSDEVRLRQLEELVHPHVQTLVNKEKGKLLNLGTEIAFYDVPLLFETNMQGMFDKIVYVHCDQKEQILRVMHRDGMTADEVKARIAHQMPADEKISQANYVINNSGAQEKLQPKLDQIIMDILLS